MVKIGCGQSGGGALKLTASEEWTDGINWFFACWYVITKIRSWSKIFRVSIVKNGCGHSGHGTQKLTGGIKDAKSWFSYFLVDVAKNGHGFLVHETLKSVVP